MGNMSDIQLALDALPTADMADQQAVIRYAEDEERIFMPGAKMFPRPEWKRDYRLAEDAQPTLVTVPNSGIPAYLTFFHDAEVLRIMTAKNRAAEIFGEEGKGDWLSTTLIFNVVENTYEVSSYGDYNNNGSANANMNFPERQPYLYQVITQYGERELEQAGLARIGWAAEQKAAAIAGLNKFQNQTYFKGVTGLQNYGIINDPALNAAIAPGPKAAGGVAWQVGNTINATPNEMFTDIQGLVSQLIAQSDGNIDVDDELVLAMSPRSKNAITATNTFNVNTMALIKNNYPNMRIESAVQYGALTAQNTLGNAAGETVQLFAPKANEQKSGYCAFNLKLRAGRVVPELSSYKQKFTQGSAGFVYRQIFATAFLVGV